MSNSYNKVEGPIEDLMRKFEEDEEIRSLLDEIFETSSVKDALECFAENLASHLQMCRGEGLFSDDEMKTLVNEYSWIQKFKSSFYVALLRDAIEELFEKEESGWDVREEVIHILKEKITPELVITSINAFEAKRLEALSGMLVLSGLIDFLGKFSDEED